MKVIFLVGPTACGKSALAMKLAKKTGGVILNADSVQLYQRLIIGSAAPLESEKKQVPHYLFAEVAPPATWTAGDYARAAHEALGKLSDSKQKIVFIVGGTGFYLQALEKGMFPVSKADPKVQAELEKKLTEVGGPEQLHQELLRLDPALKGRIFVNDHYRLARALEVMRREKRPITEIEKEHALNQKPFPFPLLKLGIRLDREKLRARLTERAGQMLARGLIAEVQGLLRDGFSDWDPLRSVGYLETAQFLAGHPEISTEQVLAEKIVQNSMRLSKRQKTWFQRDLQIKWGDSQDDSFFENEVEKFLQA